MISKYSVILGVRRDAYPGELEALEVRPGLQQHQTRCGKYLLAGADNFLKKARKTTNFLENHL